MTSLTDEAAARPVTAPTLPRRVRIDIAAHNPPPGVDEAMDRTLVEMREAARPWPGFLSGWLTYWHREQDGHWSDLVDYVGPDG